MITCIHIELVHSSRISRKFVSRASMHVITCVIHICRSGYGLFDGRDLYFILVSLFISFELKSKSSNFVSFTFFCVCFVILLWWRPPLIFVVVVIFTNAFDQTYTHTKTHIGLHNCLFCFIIRVFQIMFLEIHAKGAKKS